MGKNYLLTGGDDKKIRIYNIDKKEKIVEKVT
jgi:hypothetical protein